MRKKKNLRSGEISSMISAVITGASFDVTFNAVARKFEVINENYILTRGLSSGLLGSSLIYFGKSSEMKAAGYGLLAIAGMSVASGAGDLFNSTNNPMQGDCTRNTLTNVNSALNARRMRRNLSSVENGVVPKTFETNPYSVLAFSDAIYPV